jgi:predicted ATP-grasp superfamily ATP-dependent carboligase|tara:strand:+ start:474 stop:686 length:213 start_codon:yes stop_codon:yes gene_type:complete
MKESKLIEMSNRVDTIGAAMNRVVQELNNLKDLSIGLTELMKLLPDYEEALEKMKQNLKEQKEQEEKTKE